MLLDWYKIYTVSMYSIYVCITLLGKESNVSDRRNEMGSRISPYFSPRSATDSTTHGTAFVTSPKRKWRGPTKFSDFTTLQG